MRTLKLHFPDAALPTLETFLKQTKEGRGFRRAQAVRAIVKGQRLKPFPTRCSLLIPRYASGSIALLPRARKAWSTAPVLVDHLK